MTNGYDEHPDNIYGIDRKNPSELQINEPITPPPEEEAAKAEIEERYNQLSPEEMDYYKAQTDTVAIGGVWASEPSVAPEPSTTSTSYREEVAAKQPSLQKSSWGSKSSLYQSSKGSTASLYQSSGDTAEIPSFPHLNAFFSHPKPSPFFTVAKCFIQGGIGKFISDGNDQHLNFSAVLKMTKGLPPKENSLLTKALKEADSLKETLPSLKKHTNEALFTAVCGKGAVAKQGMSF